MIDAKNENGSERGLVKHSLNCLLIADLKCSKSKIVLVGSLPNFCDNLVWYVFS